MRRPYDLVAFMKQDERARTLSGLKDELLSRKDEIDKNEDKDTGKTLTDTFLSACFFCSSEHMNRQKPYHILFLWVFFSCFC